MGLVLWPSPGPDLDRLFTCVLVKALLNEATEATYNSSGLDSVGCVQASLFFVLERPRRLVYTGNVCLAGNARECTKATNCSTCTHYVFMRFKKTCFA
jgi:ribosomal protein L40E